MATTVLYSASLITTCLSLTIGDYDFSIWNYCEQETVCSMPLQVARYAYGSGYEPGSPEWYLIGGTVNDSAYFVTTDTVGVIEIPLAPSGEFICAELYAPALPQAFGQSVGALIEDELYSFGGFNNAWQYMPDIYQSDTITASAFGNASCELPSPLSAACSVTIESMVYIIGGLKDGTITDSVYVVDMSVNPCNVTELSSMIYTRFAPSCTTNGGKIYLFGGQELGNSSNYYFGADLDSIEIYDIASDSWSLSTQTLSYKAHWANAAYLNFEDLNLALIMGGITGFYDDFDKLDVYDMDSDTIIDRTIMPGGARYAFHSITPPHGDWESRCIMLAGGKYVVNEKGHVRTSVDRILCEVSDEPTTTIDETVSTEDGGSVATEDRESIATRSHIVVAVAVVMLMTMSQ